MGTFTVPIEIGNSDGTRFERVDALVDTGASYTFLPASTLRDLGIKPYRILPFTLADGKTKNYEIGHAIIRINGDSVPTIVAFGDEDMGESLLGAYALEGLALKVNPLEDRLETIVGHL